MRWTGFVFLFLVIGTAFALDYNISVPEEVDVGEWFSINISAQSDEDLNLTSYSYVYNGFNCVGQGWITNSKDISLPAGEKVEYQLDDLVKHGTESGFYNLRIKFKFDNETFNETYTIKVNETKRIEPIYLYIGLVVISLVGLYLIFTRR